MCGLDDDVQQSMRDDDELAFTRTPRNAPVQRHPDLVSTAMFLPAASLPLRNFTQPAEDHPPYPNSSHMRNFSFPPQPTEIQDPNRCAFGSPVNTAAENTYGITSATMPSDSYNNFHPQNEHSSFSSSTASYLGTVNSQDETQRSFDSPVHTRPHNTYGWENAGMMSSGPMSTDSYTASPQQDAHYQLPHPILTQPSLVRHNAQPLPAVWRQFETDAASASRARGAYQGQMGPSDEGYGDPELTRERDRTRGLQPELY
jgi:hypothetical protein